MQRMFFISRKIVVTISACTTNPLLDITWTYSDHTLYDIILSILKIRFNITLTDELPF
jgi:hypothetical protein